MIQLRCECGHGQASHPFNQKSFRDLIKEVKGAEWSRDGYNALKNQARQGCGLCDCTMWRAIDEERWQYILTTIESMPESDVQQAGGVTSLVMTLKNHFIVSPEELAFGGSGSRATTTTSPKEEELTPYEQEQLKLLRERWSTFDEDTERRKLTKDRMSQADVEETVESQRKRNREVFATAESFELFGKPEPDLDFLWRKNIRFGHTDQIAQFHWLTGLPLKE